MTKMWVFQVQFIPDSSTLRQVVASDWDTAVKLATKLGENIFKEAKPWSIKKIEKTTSVDMYECDYHQTAEVLQGVGEKEK